MNKRALIAMSGGVDSSVAAYLTKKEGFECTGVTMKLFVNDDVGVSREKACCSLEDIQDAGNVCYSLGIPFYVMNFTSDFKSKVIDRFVNSYEIGETPNPCIDCNRYLKFEALLDKAKQMDFEYVVTGHYAQIEYDKLKDRYLLKKGIDATKDQSYVLYSLTQEQLKHTRFPLGGMGKNEVRDLARENGFINSDKKESQDICFVVNGDYTDFIRQYTGKSYPPGDFVDMEGNVLGKHKGIIGYTIGQRKGLGLSLPEPLYVVSKNLENNTVVLGKEKDLLKKEVIVENFNWIASPKPEKEFKAKVKLRYQQKEQEATIYPLEGDRVRIEFTDPQRAPSLGQAAVAYDDDIVIGGGKISG